MSLIDSVVGEPLSKPIDAIGNAIDKIFTSDDERAQAQIVLEKLRQHPQELAMELNKIEAAHPSVFVAGWRPFIGWVCGVSLAIYYIPQFLIATVLWTYVCLKTGVISSYPIAPTSLIELVGAMLGFGFMRSYEKRQGVARQR